MLGFLRIVLVEIRDLGFLDVKFCLVMVFYIEILLL